MPHMKKSVQKSATRWVAVSGGFDPIHVGHIELMQIARKHGDKLVVILNNDNWLKNKKGFAFMPEHERASLLLAFPFVDRVEVTDHAIADPDRSVVRTLRKIQPHIFANGGDRGTKNTPEMDVCEEMGIKMVFGLGAKIQSSSWMIRDASRAFSRTVRPWGEFYGWDKGPDWNLKTIYVQPNKRLSLQYHHQRSELWILVSGDAEATIGKKAGTLKRVLLIIGKLFEVPHGYVHRLESKKGGVVVEIAQGNFDESDIVRLEDDHGRIA